MNYILKVTTRYNNSEVNTARSWAFTTYEGACKKMIENLESLNRQLMVTELTDVTGYTIELREWVTGNKYKQVAKINYDLAL
jgi:hypothetical protein